MSRDPGDIPGSLAGRTNLVEILSTASDLPVEALEMALLAPARIATDVHRVALRAAAGDVLNERDGNLLFWGLHVLAEGRDQRLFGPLMRIVRRKPDDVADLLGVAVPTTLPRLAASTFDGDVDLLEAAIVDREADELVRWNLFGALAFLTFEGRIARERAHAFLLRFDRERPARSGDAAWTGWEQAVALLGFEDLAPAVAAAREDARLLDDEADPERFALTLAAALARPDDPARFADQDLGYVEDAIAELAMVLDDPDPEEPPAPARNPLRDVGRNDPCPCGSGRKYKKCCLGAAEGP